MPSAPESVLATIVRVSTVHLIRDESDSKRKIKKNLADFASIELYCFVSGKNLSILDYANRYWTETRSNVKIFTYTMVIHDFRDRWTVPKIYSPMRTSAQTGF